MAEYELDGEYIRSLVFTKGARVNFKSAEGLFGDNDDYILNFDIFNSLSESLAKQYIAIQADTIRKTMSAKIFYNMPCFSLSISCGGAYSREFCLLWTR